MTERITVDGNEAAARIAHLANEVIAIYPITPASPPQGFDLPAPKSMRLFLVIQAME